MGTNKPKGVCSVCAGPVRWDKHHKPEFCSLKCDLLNREYFEYEKHLVHVLAEEQQQGSMLILGDCHMPFHNQYVIDKALEWNKEHKPKFVIQIGDLYDFYSWSRFPRSHNVMTPKEEAIAGKKASDYMWEKIKKDNPNCETTQIWGNHNSRPMLRMFEKTPELEHFLVEGFEKHFESKALDRMIMDPRDVTFINGRAFEHGYKKSGEHVKENQISTIVGHSHRASIQYHAVRNRIFFEMNVGHMADINSIALKYTPRKFVNWTTAFGVIDELGPRIIVVQV